MEELNLIVYFLVTCVVAGIVGTTGMTLLMYWITRTGITNANMVVAIGSIFTKSRDSAWMVGTLLHYSSGVAFAILYTLAFNLFGLQGAVAHTAVGTGFGFAHGFVMTFILVAMVAEHHPLEEFKDAGISVALAHAIGHVLFGLLIGLCVGLSGFSVAH